MGGGLLRSLRRVVGRRDTINTEPVGEGAPKAVERRGTERRREPRFEISQKLNSTDRITLSLEGNDIALTVFDLSKKGLSFEGKTTSHAIPLGSIFNASVLLGGRDVPLQLQLVNRRDYNVGCKILEAPTQWYSEVARYLDPIEIGKQLREIDSKYVKQESTETAMRWFQGGPACDLYVWQDQAGIAVQIQLFMMWQLLDWRQDKGFRSGEVAEPPDTNARVGYEAADLYSLRSPPSEEVITLAQRVMSSAENVPKAVRDLVAGFAL
jgi:hypothetical protein